MRSGRIIVIGCLLVGGVWAVDLIRTRLGTGAPSAGQLAPGETATDSFTYTVTDNNGLSSTKTATVTITGQNDAPVAVNDSYCCEQPYGGRFNVTRDRWEWRPGALWVWRPAPPIVRIAVRGSLIR